MDPNTLIIKRSKLIYPELSYKISGLAFKVHNELGRFCKESSYCKNLELLLNENNINFEREKRISLGSSNGEITKNWVDFIIDNKIVIEVKAKRFITRDDYLQTLRYLHFLNLPLGLLINFQQRFLKPKRVINNKFNH